MNLSDFPGLKGIGSKFSVQCERAIYGKVDGAKSDYRWIAASSGFSGIASRIFAETSVGQPHEPASFTAWKQHRTKSETLYYATGFYRSRARDAVGRSGALERQILEWRPGPGTPPAVAALLMLPFVAKLDDSEWFGKSSDLGWTRDEFRLCVDPLELSATREEIQVVVQTGVGWIRENMPREALERFYASVLPKASRPHLIPDVKSPPPPEALATLLLVLTPQEIKENGLSICGWVPADSAQAESFLKWDAVFAPRKFWGSPAPPDNALDEAATRVDFLLPAPDIDAGVKYLHEFAVDRYQRWLAPSGAMKPRGLSGAEEALLSRGEKAIIEHWQTLPPYLRNADGKVQESYKSQLASKLEVFSAAWLLIDSKSWKTHHRQSNGDLEKVLRLWAESSELAKQRLKELPELSSARPYSIFTSTG